MKTPKRCPRSRFHRILFFAGILIFSGFGLAKADTLFSDDFQSDSSLTGAGYTESPASSFALYNYVLITPATSTASAYYQASTPPAAGDNIVALDINNTIGDSLTHGFATASAGATTPIEATFDYAFIFGGAGDPNPETAVELLNSSNDGYALTVRDTSTGVADGLELYTVTNGVLTTTTEVGGVTSGQGSTTLAGAGLGFDGTTLTAYENGTSVATYDPTGPLVYNDFDKLVLLNPNEEALPLFDNLDVTGTAETPEPASVWMFLGGLGLLFVNAFRKKIRSL